ncbi:hypothetical protein DFH09DRAFT_1365514 [Mycena vulgaris]|nr:hypothetical protein DFH09DRAFT_1365514 [Mycena vulgaris]
MSDSDATDQALPKAPFLPFQSQCGRRGCTYVFRYEGTDPFAALAAMVKAHKPHCVGRDFGTTHRCDTGWAPSEEMAKQWERPAGDAARSTSKRPAGTTDKETMDYDMENRWEQAEDDAGMSTSEGSAGTTDMDCDTAGTRQQCRAADVPGDKAIQNGDDKVMQNAHSVLPIRRRSDATGRQCRKPKAAPATTAKQAPKKMASPQTQRTHKKKSAHTEAQRKAALEADPWTQTVELTKIVCRGCGRTIRLDGRSRYYPGLWLKHRERCTHVRSGCALSDKPRKNDAMCSDAEPANKLMTITEARCRLEDVEMPSGTLAPRTSYYRGQRR